MNTELRILSLFVLAASLVAGLVIATPLNIVEAGGNDDKKDSPSDNDQGYGNDPGNSGDAHKKNNKRD